MSKLLRISDYILLVAATAGELLDTVRLVGGIFPKLLEARYGFVPANYRKSSYLSAVSRMISTGEIKRVTSKDGKVFLELTSKGEKKFSRRFSMAAMQRKFWNGKFMIVVFDIPEKEAKIRKGLRAKLTELGFGMLQESVWISPYHFEEDLTEYLRGIGLLGYVFVITAEISSIQSVRRLAEKIWHLSKINESYKKIVIKANRLLEKRGVRVADGLKGIWEDYLITLNSDALLPKDLLPEDWAKGKAEKLLQKLALQKNARPGKKLQS